MAGCAQQGARDGRLAEAGRTRSAALRLLPIALACAAYALYLVGYTVARRDAEFDSGVLYLARYVQLAVYFAMAYLCRNHLPNVQALLLACAGCLGVHLAIGVFAVAGIFGPADPLNFVSNAFSGVANALAVLVLMHFFSTYSPRASAVGLVAAYLGREIVFGWSSTWGAGAIVAAQFWMRPAGLMLLVAALVLKRRALEREEPRAEAGESPAPFEHPMQYGMNVGSSGPERPMAFLVSGYGWLFQVVVAFVYPFLFGFASQMLSSPGMNDGLHDSLSEAGAVAAVAVLLAAVAARRRSLAFRDLFVTCTLLYATGFMLLPLLWDGQSSGAAGMAIRSACSLYEAMLFILLAHKSFDDPRHTYLYFGVFLGLANVSYGRLAGPLVLGAPPASEGAVTLVSLMFLWVIALTCLLLFVLQGREGERAAGPDGSGGLDGPAAAGQGAPRDAFQASFEELCAASGLTPREREVLVEVMHGYTMPNVAKRLCISPETVRTHMKSVYQKTGCANKQALIEKVDSLGRA